MTDTPPVPKVWQVSVDGQSRVLEQLPATVIDKIAKDCDVSWFVVVNTPLTDLAVALAIIEAVANLCDVPVPDVTVRDLAGMFDLVDEEP